MSLRVTRRVAGWAALAPFLACADGSPGDPAGGPPHVVMFLADDLGWADVGYHGSEIRTPNIDRLCESGVELDAFYVQDQCSPTRAALLTGRYPLRYGLQTGVIKPWAPEGLDPGERLLPEALKEAGYATHIVGKWHLGSSKVEELPTRRGFDHHYGLYTGLADYFTRDREGGLDWHRDEVPSPEEGYTTHLLRDEAVRVIEEHDAATPLFLYVAFSAPHYPLQAPADEIAAYADEIADERRRTYAAMVTCMDEAIGAVLAALDARGLRGDALVVFLSDNGASPEYGGSNAPLSGGKSEMYEGGVRVPCAASWSGRLPAGAKVGVPVHAVDWYPTLLGLAGVSVEQPRPVDGVDLWPLLARGEEPDRAALLVNMTPNAGALRQGRWKLVVDYVARVKGDVEEDPLLGVELFDLVDDPGETTNRASDAMGNHMGMIQRLARFRREMAPQDEGRFRARPDGFVSPEVWGPGPPR